MNQKQLSTLRSHYATINSIDPCGQTYIDLIKSLDAMSIGMLRTLADARIKFISPLAINRVKSRCLAA